MTYSDYLVVINIDIFTKQIKTFNYFCKDITWFKRQNNQGI